MLVALLLASPAPAGAWGFTAHRLVNARAIETLPPPLRAFFARNADYVSEHSIDPDLWRAAGREGEGPNHYLDLDEFGVFPFDAIPQVEAEHLARHGAAARERGRVPWRVAEVYGELVQAFAAHDAARALERAAVLGHYLGDAHVPLHAVRNHDGQLSGQAGLHARWESELVERYLRQLETQVRVDEARTVGDPVAFTFGVLRESFQASPQVLASDLASGGPADYADTPFDDRYGPGYYSSFYEREGPLLVARLARSASAIGSLWLSAWEQAGRPELPEYRVRYVRGSTRMVLVSLDGASAPVVDDGVARGIMPHLARVRAGGATARGSVTSLPAKTAAGHATLFTGTWPDRHGIAGNEVPVPGASVLQSVSGYSSGPLRAEPIWVTAARQGLDVSVFSATQVFPFAPYLEEKRFGANFGRNLTLMDGYQGYTVGEAVYTARELSPRPSGPWTGDVPASASPPREISFAVDGTRVQGLVYDDPADPVTGLDTVLLSLTRDLGGAVRLKPHSVDDHGTSDWVSLPIRTDRGELRAHFRLFALSPDASDILLYRAEAGVLSSNKPLVEVAALRDTEGFVGNGGSRLYEEGRLGPPLWAGGDGTAERRYLETVRLVVRQFSRLLDFGYHSTRWHLLVGYLPYPDEALHLWKGYLDPTLPGFDAALAARLRPYMDEVLRISDGYVGHLLEHTRNDQVLAVAADHGQIGIDRVLRPNVVLVRAGLLALDPSGGIDLSRTQAIYFPGNSGYFLINRAGRPGGIVRPEDEDGVRARLTAALRAVRDPEDGHEVVTELIDVRAADPALGVGGPSGGDVYLNLAPRYYLSAATRGDPVTRVPPAGEHMLDPGRRDMRAAFALAGPGVAAGADLGLIRQVDIAPTLCALLGIDPPPETVGSALTRALDGANLVPATAP